MTDQAQPQVPQGPTLGQQDKIPAIEKLQKFLQDEKITLTIGPLSISKADDGSVLVKPPTQIIPSYLE